MKSVSLLSCRGGGGGGSLQADGVITGNLLAASYVLSFIGYHHCEWAPCVVQGHSDMELLQRLKLWCVHRTITVLAPPSCLWFQTDLACVGSHSAAL